MKEAGKQEEKADEGEVEGVVRSQNRCGTCKCGVSIKEDKRKPNER